MSKAETSKPLLRAAITAASLALAACSSNAGPEAATQPSQDTTAAPLPQDGFSAGDVGEPQDTGASGDAVMVPGDESVPPPPSESFAAGASMKATANVNLRKGPSTSDAILAVIPSGTVVALVSSSPTNGFYNVIYDGTTGWSYAAYLTPVSSTPPPPSGGGGATAGDPEGPLSVANAIARAQAAVGFSYYWGGGAWLASGPTASTKGSCSGSCPSCSHSGSYGADCSGMVAKAWYFGADLATNSHPYATSSFVSDVSGHWSTVSRSSLKRGDAMVYNSGGAGHIVLWESGDGWGSSTVYECKGCAYGCVHDTRTFSSSYHGIRRAGF